MVKIALVGNCQVTALHACLRRVPDLEVVAVVDINCLNEDHIGHAIHKIEYRVGVDVLFSHQMGAGFGAMASDKLRQRYGTDMHSMTNIYFTGLHPDISYFGTFGSRVLGPIGDYHSRICLISFLKGRSVDECLSLFREETYAQLGYFDEFEKSRLELEQRDNDIDIPVCAALFGRLHKTRSLYSVNHPTSDVIDIVADKICETISVRRPSMTRGLFANPLANSTVWPIYPEVALRHQLAYSDNMLFFPNLFEATRPMSLDQFIRSSYQIYSEIGHSAMRESSLAQSLAAMEV